MDTHTVTPSNSYSSILTSEVKVRPKFLERGKKKKRKILIFLVLEDRKRQVS